MMSKRTAAILAAATLVALAVTPSWTDAEEHVAARPDRKSLVVGWYTVVILVGVSAALALETRHG